MKKEGKGIEGAGVDIVEDADDKRERDVMKDQQTEGKK